MKTFIKKAVKLTLIGVGGLIVISFVYYGILDNSARQRSSFSQNDMMYEGSMSGATPSSTGLRSNSFSLPSLQSSKKITTTSSSSNNSSTAVQGDGALTQRKIIKNGQLLLLVKSIELSSDQITAIAKRADGYVQNSSVNKGIAKELKNATITVRVPAEDFENV